MREKIAGAMLDACVLFPMHIRDTLLRTAQRGLFRVQFTEKILEETRRNLVAEGQVTEEGAERLIRTLREAFPGAVVTRYKRHVGRMLNHAGDRHVAAAAYASKCQYIVTLNTKHFRHEHMAPFGLAAVSPDEFLTMFLDRNPQAMLELLRSQQAALRKPPLDMEALLKRLQVFAPTFVRRLASETDILSRPNTTEGTRA